MQVALTDLKMNVGHYVDMAATEEVIVTKYGKPAARIIRFDKEPWYTKHIPKEVTSIEQLFDTLPPEITLDEARLERLSE